MTKLTLITIFTYLLVGCNHSNKNTEKIVFEQVKSNITFYKQKPPKNGHPVIRLQALYRGNLVSENNCLLLESQGNYYNPIWPHDVSLSIANGTLSVIRENKVLLILNNPVKIGGGEMGIGEDLLKEYKVPNKCRYKFWLVGEILDQS
jgi:hypothetical protein